MSKPSPNRNRANGLLVVAELAHRYRRQLNEKLCAQKESNLQPASSGETPHGLNPAKTVTNGGESAPIPPAEPRSAESKRAPSVTEATDRQAATATSLRIGGAPYALSSRPDILGYLEGVTLAGRMR